MAFSEVGCSEIIINIEKIQDVCNPSHCLCILSVTEKYYCPEIEQLLYMYSVCHGKKHNYRINGFTTYFVPNITYHDFSILNT